MHATGPETSTRMWSCVDIWKMVSHIAPPLKIQAKTPIIGDTFRLNPQFIQSRQSIDEADGGGTVVRLGVSKADIPRVGGNRVEIFREADEPPIELHQSLDLIVTGSYIENWTMGPATIIEAVAEIVQFTPKFYVRVDGISMPDCRALEKRFGPGFPALIEANPDILSKTRFSKEKQDIIFKACKREILARKKDTAGTLNIVAMLCACGVTKAKARTLAAAYDSAKSPYQFFFKGRLTFLQADRVAKLIDPKRASRGPGICLFIIDQFLLTQHIVVRRQDIRSAVWNNFGVDYLRVDDEIERLVDLGVVRKM